MCRNIFLATFTVWELQIRSIHQLPSTIHIYISLLANTVLVLVLDIPVYIMTVSYVQVVYLVLPLVENSSCGDSKIFSGAILTSTIFSASIAQMWAIQKILISEYCRGKLNKNIVNLNLATSFFQRHVFGLFYPHLCPSQAKQMEMHKPHPFLPSLTLKKHRRSDFSVCQ